MVHNDVMMTDFKYYLMLLKHELANMEKNNRIRPEDKEKIVDMIEDVVLYKDS